MQEHNQAAHLLRLCLKTNPVVAWVELSVFVNVLLVYCTLKGCDGKHWEYSEHNLLIPYAG